MKSKLLIIAFIAILICSALNVALTIAECSTCNGTGEIVCSYCQGTGEITIEEGTSCETCLGFGVLTPTITGKGWGTQLNDGKAFVQASFENEEEVGAYGKVNVEVEAPSATYKATSSRTLFPPKETIEIIVTIEGISISDYNTMLEDRSYPTNVWLSEVEDAVCPNCDGTGTIFPTIDCPICDGTGFVDCPDCGGSEADSRQNENLNIPLDITGPAVGVAMVAGVGIAAYAVVKKRKVSEKDLRKLSVSEFQNWVLGRLTAKPSSPRDSHMGIDGFTTEGKAILIKQSDGIGRDVIDKFAVAMGQRNTKNGIIVAFSFGNDAYRGKVRARLNYRLEIEMVTVQELIESRKGAF